MNKKLVFIGVLLLLSSFERVQAGGVPPPSEEHELAIDVDLTDPGRIERGRKAFNSSSAAFCHGLEPPLFMGRKGLEADYVFQTIKGGGRGATPMPPWGDVFSPDEIWDLVAYVEFLGTQTPSQVSKKQP